MRRVAVLLRGVNVGGHGKLPMADLRRFLIDLGYPDARTLLASGNAVVASDQPGEELERRLEAAFAERLGRTMAVLVRDATEFDALIAANPFPAATQDHPQHVLVTFGREPCDPGLLDRLRATYQGPESLVAVGRELVIDYAENVGESKLDQAMRKLRFPAIATARNWNTVLKLRAML